MGKINRGILGGFSGKVANIIGGSWKGIAYMRSQPVSVANPNTTAQQNQRNAFSGVVALAVFLLQTIVKPLNDRFAQGMSGFNLFTQRNIEAFDSNGDFVPGTGLEISRGDLLGVDSLSGTGLDGQKDLNVTFGDNSGGNALRQTDKFFVCAINVTQGTFGVYSSLVDRTAGSATVDMQTDMAENDEVYVYAAFRSDDGRQVSNTASTMITVTI